MSRKSSIFIRNATVLDCALAIPHIGPRGKSWHVDIAWEGDTDAEGIVFDFALAKKAAKDTIDKWFDHRLLVPESSIIKRDSDRVVLGTSYVIHETQGFFALDTYEESVAILPDDVFLEMRQSGRTNLLSSIIAKCILEVSPKSVSNVRVTLREPLEAALSYHFSYTHSLRQHSGNCQRFHGHSNIVEIFQDGELNLELCARAAQFLDASYLIPKIYLQENELSPRNLALLNAFPQIEKSAVRHAHIEYSGSQGSVALILPAAAVTLMPQESTIENISAFLRESLELGANCSVVAYEGIQKGSIG
jgi:6-pyruvoyl-tetrahydropterin synthase